jgi:cytochrome P450
MVKQMLFLDPPARSRIRRLVAASTQRRVEILRAHIREIADALIDRVVTDGAMEVMADVANPLPAIVLRSLEEMPSYFHEAVRRQAKGPGEGLVGCLATAEVDGDRLTEGEVVANLFGSGLLTLRHPEDRERLREDFSLIPTAIEELQRYESPSQHIARLVPEALDLDSKHLMKGQAVIAVMGAANWDPERYTDPDHLDIARPEKRRLAFGWAAHHCFGAPLARIEGQVVFRTILRRLPGLHLGSGPITWRPNLGLRGLSALHVEFS